MKDESIDWTLDRDAINAEAKERARHAATVHLHLRDQGVRPENMELMVPIIVSIAAREVTERRLAKQHTLGRRISRVVGTARATGYVLKRLLIGGS